MRASPSDLVTRWFVELWRDRKPEVIGAIRSDKARSTGLAQHAIDGVDGFRAFYERAIRLITDTDVRFDSVVEQGDSVAAHVTITGKVRGKPIELRCAAFARVGHDGLVAEARNVIDVAAFMRQLGYAGPATLAEAIALLEAEG